ncbi:hypothetical protein PFISCL1PPCAC_11924, partial [Pristionchus fissidentatus]
ISDHQRYIAFVYIKAQDVHNSFLGLSIESCESLASSGEFDSRSNAQIPKPFHDYLIGDGINIARFRSRIIVTSEAHYGRSKETRRSNIG